MHPLSDYRDLSSLSTPLKIMLWLGATVATASLISSMMVVSELNAPGYHPSTEPSASDIREGAIGIAHLVLYLATAVVFCRWIHRAHKNLATL
jgi:hypothetical protein